MPKKPVSRNDADLRPSGPDWTPNGEPDDHETPDATDISRWPEATDNADSAESLRRVLKLRAKVLAAKSRAESHKAALKETDVYKAAKDAADNHKGLEAELNELLAELDREYPLFERRSP